MKAIGEHEYYDGSGDDAQTSGFVPPIAGRARGYSCIEENEPILSAARKGLMDLVIHEHGDSHCSTQRVKDGTALVQLNRKSPICPDLSNTTQCTFLFPDLTKSEFDDNYRSFIEKDLVDLYSMKTLQKLGMLNNNNFS